MHAWIWDSLKHFQNDTYRQWFNPGIGGLTQALVNKDIETGDNLIKDHLASIGKTSTNMLSIKEQKRYQNKFEKDPKFDNYRIGKPVLLDIPV